ncbi:MAG TPA: Crp/Fnr family transcriptional regulator [Terriglobales bacterium]|jgi:CRP/FNR family transcriptional regulator|nr:Crp/Fnr family transcriptional regulator [Terriglobales bacterium]
MGIPSTSLYIDRRKPWPVLPSFDGGKANPPARRFTRKPLTTHTREGLQAGCDPLYLFHCSVLWHREADTASGWELVQTLRSWDEEARAIAAAMLAKTEKARLLAKDLRRTTKTLRQAGSPETFKEDETTEVNDLKTPYGLEIIENCQGCKLRQEGWFCSLPPEALRSFSSATRPAIYPGGAVLFVAGQAARGAFVLCSGKVKLSTTSREGKVLIVKMAQPGEVLGLSAVITGQHYEFSAETSGPCQVNFVERQALLRLMEKHGELGLNSAQTLSREFQSVFRDIHELVLSRSSAGKLARLLLSWTPVKECLNSPEPKIRSCMTHEEMAQMIGASRETVTRLLNELKKKELIRLEGSTLVIRNRTALEAMAA